MPGVVRVVQVFCRSGSLRLDVELFEQATISRLQSHFKVLLKGMLENPDLPVSHLPLLTDQERHQLLTTWNDTAVEYPEDVCLHQRFEIQVEKTPDAVALEHPHPLLLTTAKFMNRVDRESEEMGSEVPTPPGSPRPAPARNPAR